MTLEEIVRELEKLDNLQFSLVTMNRKHGEIGNEQLFSSLQQGTGMPEDPGIVAWLLCRGIQRALDLCSDQGWAAEVSVKAAAIQQRLGNWPGRTT